MGSPGPGGPRDGRGPRPLSGPGPVVLAVDGRRPDAGVVARCAAALLEGRLLIFPTETRVWGYDEKRHAQHVHRVGAVRPHVHVEDDVAEVVGERHPDRGVGRQLQDALVRLAQPQLALG